MSDHIELFQRHEKNQILLARNWPYPANSVFNRGAAKIGDYTMYELEDIKNVVFPCGWVVEKDELRLLWMCRHLCLIGNREIVRNNRLHPPMPGM